MLILSNIKTLYTGDAPEKKPLKRGVDIFIEKGLIKHVRPHDRKLRLGNRHRRADCTGLTVTPGLVDCHGHITVLGLRGQDMDFMNQGQGALLFIEKILHASLIEGGVTTMRDIGGATHFMKQMVDEGIMIGPRLKIAICMLSTTGGHADFRGPDRCHATLQRLWPAIPGRPSNIVDGPWECRKRVREIAACGADLIKICASPGVASPGDKLEHREFTEEEIQAITDEAEYRGLRVAAHAHSINGIDLAIRNGVHDIQHISFMEERQVEDAYAKGCTVTPTSWIIQDLARAKGLAPSVMEKVRQVKAVHAKATQYAAKGGLKILMGTDPVLPGMHGRNFMELRSLINEGLSPLQAWHGGTGLAADEIGQDDTGFIKPGKRADLLICKGDVINKPELLGKGALLEVVKDGVGYRGGFAEIEQRTFGGDVRKALDGRFN